MTDRHDDMARDIVDERFSIALGVTERARLMTVVAEALRTVEREAADLTEGMKAALLSAKANMLDHQGRIIPLHLVRAVVREIDNALKRRADTTGMRQKNETD